MEWVSTASEPRPYTAPHLAGKFKITRLEAREIIKVSGADRKRTLRLAEALARLPPSPFDRPRDRLEIFQVWLVDNLIP